MLPGLVPGDDERLLRARPDEAHLPPQHIEQLRQLIEVGRPQDLADARHARLRAWQHGDLDDLLAHADPSARFPYPYSGRDGRGWLDAAVREERRQRFMAVAEAVSVAKLARRVGATMQVLVDSAPALGRKGGVGRSYADAPEIDGTVRLLPPAKASKTPERQPSPPSPTGRHSSTSNSANSRRPFGKTCPTGSAI